MSMPLSPSSDSISSGEGVLSDVQDILAQRRTLSGKIEFLVVWRSSWIADHKLADGPVLRSWHAVSKFKTKGAMAITLPVVRGTQLYADCRRVIQQRDAQQDVSHNRVLGADSASAVVPAPDLSQNLAAIVVAPVLSPSIDAGSRKQLDDGTKRVRGE